MANTKKTAPKTRAPKAPKARSVQETIELMESKLTDKEKINLIKFLKQNTIGLGTKIKQLEMNIESTRLQLQQMQKQYNEMELYYKNSLDYVDKQTKAFSDAITKATYGGLN